MTTASGYGPDWSAGLRNGSEAELDAWLALALALCDTADEMALAAFRRDLVITAKPDRTFVTEADQAIERMIRERIADAHPDHGVVGEEYGTDGADATVRWYVDPIDGTHNFMRGVPVFGTLIGIERDGELQVGIISAPALGARWYARRGGGSWAVDAIGPRAGSPRRIEVSRVSQVADAQLFHGSSGDVIRSGRAPGFDGLARDMWRVRGLGDCWGYALVADGAGEAMIEADLSSWDMAGPQVVVEEAGGRMTDMRGVRSIHDRTAVATNGILHEEVLRRLAGG